MGMGRERVLVLVKALPHVGDRHGETVCCAGITEQLHWRRQFPIRFRELDDDKFRRWDWIEYDWRKPELSDQRLESRRVQEGTIRVVGHLKSRAERVKLLNQIIVNSVEEAASKNQTLALIRPINVKFSWRKKSQINIDKEKYAYAQAVSQLSFFGGERDALEPCPYEFHFDYFSADGKPHKHKCGDWETAATFFNWRNLYGEESTLERMLHVFGEELPEKGMAFAMGTHSQYPDSWLLVGVIRLDETPQMNLSL